MKKLVIIHTTLATISGLGALAEKLLPDVRVVNILDDSILKDMIEGTRVDAVETRWITYARMGQLMGADAVLSACSTVGEFAEKADKELEIPVCRIDDAMAREAVKRGGRIAVFATLPSTLGPTADLIRRKAQEEGAECQLDSNLVEGAYEQLMCGNKEEHDLRIRTSVSEKLKEADVIVLAQASMASALGGMNQDELAKVLTSPESGMAMMKNILA